MAVEFLAQAQQLCRTAADCGLPNVAFTSSTLGQIISLLYKVLAACSILFLMFGAFKYAASGGDSAGIKNAKETILYAVFGLIISLLAFVAVTYLSNRAGGL